MTWKIDNKSHLDGGIANYIENIFNKTADYILSKLGAPPLGIKPISLKYDCTNGPIVYWPLKTEQYEIGLCVQGNFPFQIVYQVAHELCHIYIDPRMNGVFTEVICQKTAIDILQDIGASLVAGGQKSVDDYIQDLKEKAEQQTGESLDAINLDWIKKTVTDLENKNELLNRKINDLIAFKLKEVTDPIDKYGFIGVVKNSVDTPPNPDIADLATIPTTKIHFPSLVENIEKNNKLLADALASWK